MSPSYHHGYLCSKLNAALSKIPDVMPITELTLRIGNDDYIPDISLYPRRTVNFTEKDIVRMTEMPETVIEILSPTQMVQDILEKFEIYFQAGIKSCWLVTPFAQTVSVYHAMGDAKVFHNEEIVDAAMNIRIAFDEVFG
ncbi:protein containing DUF820 [Candidatus Moduliflexus flocculans]|uniref:Protein containing DUF820 n=1 Tax=Candidatus Moduliflexus flocculans TaxID=1499966 RepID=A0A0S6VQU1_9BACT|nr:protein containing DUF820 [Candidatus Moduliflexus flocculans]